MKVKCLLFGHNWIVLDRIIIHGADVPNGRGYNIKYEICALCEKQRAMIIYEEEE